MRDKQKSSPEADHPRRVPQGAAALGPGRAQHVVAPRRGREIRIDFPTTEIQAYGATVILYTTYEADWLVEGKTNTLKGAATEVFVRRNGRWLNTGWQLEP